MGSLVCPCCCCCYFKAAVRCLHWTALYSQSIATGERPMGRLHWSAFSSQRDCVWQLIRFASPKWRSELNRIGHPDWVKLSVELNCVPNQNTKYFSSLHVSLSLSVFFSFLFFFFLVFTNNYSDFMSKCLFFFWIPFKL